MSKQTRMQDGKIPPRSEVAQVREEIRQLRTELICGLGNKGHLFRLVQGRTNCPGEVVLVCDQCGLEVEPRDL